MEYEDVVERLVKISKDSSENVETLLGYLFYEEENSYELLPIEYDDIENLISHSKSMLFSLHDGEDMSEALQKCIDELEVKEEKNIETVIIKFIGSEGVSIEDIYRSLSLFEFSVKSRSPFDLLLSATIDPALEDRGMAIVVLSSDSRL